MNSKERDALKEIAEIAETFSKCPHTVGELSSLLQCIALDIKAIANGYAKGQKLSDA